MSGKHRHHHQKQNVTDFKSFYAMDKVAPQVSEGGLEHRPQVEAALNQLMGRSTRNSVYYNSTSEGGRHPADSYNVLPGNGLPSLESSKAVLRDIAWNLLKMDRVSGSSIIPAIGETVYSSLRLLRSSCLVPCKTPICGWHC